MWLRPRVVGPGLCADGACGARGIVCARDGEVDMVVVHLPVWVAIWLVGRYGRDGEVGVGSCDEGGEEGSVDERSLHSCRRG